VFDIERDKWLLTLTWHYSPEIPRVGFYKFIKYNERTNDDESLLALMMALKYDDECKPTKTTERHQQSC